MDKSERKIQAVAKAYDKLNKYKEELLKQKEEIKLLPDIKDIQTKQVKLQSALDGVNNKMQKLTPDALSNNMDLVNTKIKDATNRFDILAQQSASLKFHFKDDENWNAINAYVGKRDVLENQKSKQLNEQIDAYKQQEAEIIQRIDDTVKNKKIKNKEEIVKSLKSDLDDTRREIGLLTDQLSLLDINKQLTSSYKKSLSNARKSKGKDYNYWGEGKPGLKMEANWQRTQQGRFESFAIDTATKFIPDSTLAALERDKEKIITDLQEIKKAKKEASKKETKQLDINNRIEDTDKHINSVNAEMKNVNKETDMWKQRLQEVKDEINNIKKQIEMVIEDTQKNPSEQLLKSDVFSQYNTSIDNLNRKWGALGGTVSRLKAKLAGIKGYMHQTTFLTRVWHKIWQNIYSQIAGLLNPLSLFRKAWNSWLDRFENKAWKNTFDVIKYNLVTVLAPFLEWCAKLLLKIAAIANVFTKKWFGVDLFDKSAWSLDKINKGMDQLTASFDELHSNTDNPDENNTIFDKFIDASDLITPEWMRTLENWADGLADTWQWIKDNWKWLVAAWAGYKLGKGLLDILDWGTGLKDIFSSLANSGLGGLLSTLSVVAGTLLVIKSIWDGIEWTKNWGGMTVEERKDQGYQNIQTGETGGALIGAGLGWKNAAVAGAGLTGKITGAIKWALIGDGIAEAIEGGYYTAVSTIKGDKENTVNFSTKLGEGIGKAVGTWGGAKIGAAIGTAIAPGVGTAIGSGIGMIAGYFAGGKLGEGAGKGIGSGLNDITEFFKGKGDFQALNISDEDVQKAYKSAQEAITDYNKKVSELNTLQKETKISGKELYNEVQNGTKSYWGLSESQKKVFDAYNDAIKSEETVIEKSKQSLEYFAKQEEGWAKSSGNFKKYIKVLEDGYDQNAISYDNMTAHFAQTLVGLDKEQQKVFLEQLPKYVRQSVLEQAEEYVPGFNKMMDGIGNTVESAFNKMGSFIGGARNELNETKITLSDLSNATMDLYDAQTEQAKAQAEVNRWEKITNQDSKKLYESVRDGKIAYSDLTQSEKTLIDKYYDLQQTMKKTDDATKKHSDVLIGLAWQSGKTSGDYSKFINTVIEENKKGNISVEDMETKFEMAYANMDENSRKTFIEKIPKNMQKGVEEGSTKFMTGFDGFLSRVDLGLKKLNDWFANLGPNIGQALNDLGKWFDEVGQKIGNFFGGKGFKTNTEIQQQEERKAKENEILEQRKSTLRTTYGIKSLDVGTNYVPNDGLAYIHKGEAVVPAKYNNPYTPPVNSKLENAVNTLTRQVEQISQKIQDGIPVTGQFVQRGSDLVATVEKASNRLSNNILNNKVYAR